MVYVPAPNQTVGKAMKKKLHAPVQTRYSCYSCALIKRLYFHAMLLPSSPRTSEAGTAKLSLSNTLANRDVSHIFQRRSRPQDAAQQQTKLLIAVWKVLRSNLFCLIA